MWSCDSELANEIITFPRLELLLQVEVRDLVWGNGMKEGLYRNFWDATTFLSNRSEFSFIWGWGCHSPLGGRKREFVWKWPGTREEKEMESDVVVISLPVSLNPRVPESLSFLTIWDVFPFFSFWSHFGTSFVSLCIHKRESWLTTVFLTSLSETVSWCGPPTWTSGPIWIHWSTEIIHLIFICVFASVLAPQYGENHLSLYSLQRFFTGAISYNLL